MSLRSHLVACAAGSESSIFYIWKPKGLSIWFQGILFQFQDARYK